MLEVTFVEKPQMNMTQETNKWIPNSYLIRQCCELGNSIFAKKLILNVGATHYDGIPDDLKEIFHPHWGTFPPQVLISPDIFSYAWVYISYEN